MRARNRSRRLRANRKGRCGYSGGSRGGEGFSGIGVALEAFEVGADFGGALVADFAIFLEGFADGAIEIVGRGGIRCAKGTWDPCLGWR